MVHPRGGARRERARPRRRAAHRGPPPVRTRLHPAARRAALLGDGFFPATGAQADIAPIIQIMYKEAENIKRDPKTIEITVVVIAGTPEGVIRDIPRYEELGVTRLILDFPSFVSDIQEMEDMLNVIASGTPLNT